jgi:hypothetical protein
MLVLAKGIMIEYHTLVVKMAFDSTSNASIKANLDMLCNIEVLYTWVCSFVIHARSCE